MRSLYPPIQPYASQMRPVSDGHTLYVEQCGNPDGLPVVFLHGGPGAGCEAVHRQFFDPQRYQITLFDQRGCGRSTPHAELNHNTTWDLVADIETLRQQLGISRWLVFGGSWGATLALAYAERYPEQVLGLILRGIFLGRARDVQWFYQDGANRLFPDLWAHLLELVPLVERADIVTAYYRLLTADNELLRLRAAKAWASWEGATLRLEQRQWQRTGGFGDAHKALSLARIEAHYFVNHCFLDDDQLLRDAPRLASIPGTIVQGRYDVITPVDGAWALHQVWPQAELRIVSPAAHSASEPGLVDALVTATDLFAKTHAQQPQ